MGAFKNALKKILPPPVNSFMREVNRIVALEEKNQELMNQLIDKIGRQQHQIELQDAAIEYQKKLLKEQQTDIMAEFENYKARISYLENVVKQAVALAEDSKENTKQLLQMEESQDRKQDELNELLAQNMSAIIAYEKEQQIAIYEFKNELAQKQQEQSVLLDNINASQSKYAEAFDVKMQSMEDYLHKQTESMNKLIVEEKNAVKKQYDEQQRTNKDLRSRIDNNNKEITYHYFKGLHPDQYKEALVDWYYQKTGVHMDIDNPKTFNEKIQWLKLYDSTPQKTRLADKYLVREWVAEQIGEEYLIPLLGVYDKFDDIDFDVLPDQFVMKANHGSGWNIVVKDKDKFDAKAAKWKFDSWMNKNFAFWNGLELHYKDIVPKITVEKYIADLDGDVYDYRFFCFNGKVEYVWVDIGSGTSQHYRSIFDSEWNIQNYTVSYPLIIPQPEKPFTLEKMKELASKLSDGFSFVRVDFYSIGEKIYFGEMTFTPQSGLAKWEKSDIDMSYNEKIMINKG